VPNLTSKRGAAWPDARDREQNGLAHPLPPFDLRMHCHRGELIFNAISIREFTITPIV